jgi:hypothetical protein
MKTIGLCFRNKALAKSFVRQNHFDVAELKSKLSNWQTPLSLPRKIDRWFSSRLKSNVSPAQCLR